MTGPRVTAHLGRASLGNSAWYLNQLITFLAVGEDTGGQFALLRVHATQGATASIPHVHAHEDETIYMLDGELTITVGGKEVRVRPGEMITIPRGAEHLIWHDAVPVRFLLQFNPAGFERYFHEMSAPAEYLGPPSDPATPDVVQMAATASRYGCTFTRTSPRTSP